MCGISTYKQVKILSKALQHCCEVFLSSRGLAGASGSLSEGGCWIMVYENGHEQKN